MKRPRYLIQTHYETYKVGRRRKYNKELPQRMYYRGRSYYYVDKLTNRWINLGKDYVYAMRRYGELTAVDAPSQSMSDLINRYLREVSPEKAEATYKHHLKQAKYLRTYFGGMPPRDVTKQHVYAYKNLRGKASKVQANRDLSLLSEVFKAAEEWGDVAFSPFIGGVKRFREKPRDRYVADWEYLRFKEHAGPLIAAYLDFKLLTGLRQGDMLSLRLSQIKDDGIHVKIRKTGKSIVIQWSDELRSAVKAARNLPRPVRGMYLFCTRRGSPYTGDGFRSNWHRAMKSALSKGVLSERFREHDIRAKTGSDTDLDHAVKLLGHTDVKTTQRHYRRRAEVVRPLR